MNRVYKPTYSWGVPPYTFRLWKHPHPHVAVLGRRGLGAFTPWTAVEIQDDLQTQLLEWKIPASLGFVMERSTMRFLAR
jgi:hypothetical protein